MEQYVGLDVSMEETAICVRDAANRVVREGKVTSAPSAIAAWLGRHAPRAARVGFETGPLSSWLYHELSALGVPAVCVDARQAHAVLKLRANKTDRIDADGLAEMMRVGWFRPVEVKSYAAHAGRALLAIRTQLVRIRVDLENQARGVLKTFGLKVGRARGAGFASKVAALTEARPGLAALTAPLMTLLRQVRLQLVRINRRVRDLAGGSAVARRLMSAPGVGPVVALAYMAEIDEPRRFRRSESVGAYLGLTPKRFQSGEADYSGRISRRGDGSVRALLFEAASVLLTRTRRGCPLKTWGLRLAKRLGWNKARVAVARKLAVLLHRLWLSGETFRWPEKEVSA